MSWATAIMLSLPGLVLCAWYSYAALSVHYRHAMAIKQSVPLSVELFQLHLHDALVRDERRLSIPDPVEESVLPTYGLVLSNDALDRLGRMLPPGEGERYYVNGHLTRGADIYEVEVRHRGGKHWNWNHPQKSWKVRVRGTGMFDGRATFNFLNTPEPMPFDEHLILEVAHEQGLLAPDYYPFRLLLNKAYMGVYFFETQPDEGLLRRDGRMPGSIYSGNEAPVDPKTGVSSLWKTTEYWNKVGRVDQADNQDKQELEVLIRAVNDASPQRFADFAAEFLDIHKFAVFDAIDVVFGVDQHDFDQNHKLYFDPYKGRFEPIAWNFRGAEHERELNRTENPLLLRLKQLPEYLSLRNSEVLRLLDGTCSSAAIEQRVNQLLADLEQDQIRDAYWDAYQLLPDLGKYYDEMPRPMNRELQAKSVQARMDEQSERERYLRDVLTGSELEVGFEQQVGRAAAAVDVSVGGASGYQITGVAASWPANCAPSGWTLFGDTDFSSELEIGRDQVLAEVVEGTGVAQPSLAVYPGIETHSRAVHPRRGAVKAESIANTYRFFIASGDCVPTRVQIKGESLVTGLPFELDTDNSGAALVPEPREGLCCGLRAWPQPGEHSAHPWCYRDESPARVQLGPGEVVVDKTRIYGEDTVVEIAPGTTLKFAENASVIFRGPVFAHGRADAKIRFLPQGSQKWGGVALQGPGASGSRLSHLEVEGGSRPTWSVLSFDGMLSIHDAQDIELSHLSLRRNVGSAAALHVAYVQRLALDDADLIAASADAVDLKFSSVRISRLRVLDAGGDCLDLMGGTVDIRDSVFLRWKDSAVTAGEQSEVWFRDSMAADGNIGVSVENSSSVTFDGSLLYRNNVGVRLEPVSQRYADKSHLLGAELYAVQCARQIEAPARKLKKVGRVADQVADGELESLRRHVLGLSDWHQLDRWIAAQKGPAVP